jgi:hypothetical protein
MNRGDEITIRKVGNGFMVTPAYDIRGGSVVAHTEVMVFQQLGDPSAGNYPQTLMDWLLVHFGDGKK